MDAAQVTSQPTSNLASRCPSRAWRGVLGVLLASIAWCLAGCGSSATSRIEPARTSAEHETRRERPGATTLTITIEPATTPTTPTTPTSPAAPQDVRRKAAPVAPVAMAVVEPDLAETLRAAAEAAERTGARVTFQYRQEPLSADTSRSALDDRGPGLETRGGELATDLAQRPRRLSLPWDERASASGGGFALSATAAGRAVNALHILGGVVLIAAVIPVVLPPRRIGLAAAIAGVGLLIIAAGTVAEEYPWLMAIAMAALVAALGYLAVEAWRAERRRRAIEAIVPAVEHAPAAEDIKAEVLDAAGDMHAAVRAEVRAIKRHLGI